MFKVIGNQIVGLTKNIKIFSISSSNKVTRLVDRFNDLKNTTGLTTKAWDRMVKGVESKYGANAANYLRNVANQGNAARASVEDFYAAMVRDIPTHGFRNVQSVINTFNTLDPATQQQFAQAIGLTNRNLGNYLANLNGARAGMAGYAGELVVTTAKTIALRAASMALNAVIGLGISLLISWIVKLANRQKELAQATREAAEAAKEEASAIKELYNEYFETSQAYKDGSKSKEDLINVTDQLLEKLGYEKTTIEELVEKYGDLDTAINTITIGQLDDKIDKFNSQLAESEKKLNKVSRSITKDVFGREQGSIWTLSGLEEEYYSLLETAGLFKRVYDTSGEFSLDGLMFRAQGDNIESVKANLKDIDSAIELIKNNFWEKDYQHNHVYLELVRIKGELEEVANDYNSWINEINNTAALKVVRGSLLGREIPKTKEELKAFKQELIDTYVAGDKWKKNQFVNGIDEARSAIENCLRSFPEFKRFFAEDLPEGTDKATPSVKKLTDAYEELSEVLDDLFSKQDKLADLYEKIAKSTELSASEARELVDLFPELTNHLVRVGSKWSFDIKGVNEAFDKIEDEFVQKAQETIDNNKKVLEQSFEDYYAENTKVSLDKILEDFGADPNDTSSPEYEAALFEYGEQLRTEKEDLLEAYKNRWQEANAEVEKAIALQQMLNAQINDFDFDVDNYNDKIKELMDASEKMAEGESLSYEELTSLIDKFPDLTYSGNDGEYFIEKSALDELIKKSYEERNARIDDEIAKTYAVNEEVANRVKAYEDEAARIESAIEENRKKFDESYNNPDSTEGVLERIELEAERGKLIDELKALDKEQYEADKALMESQSQYSEAYRKYLEALKGELTGSSKDDKISDELQNEIDYYNNIISAVEIMRDKCSEAIDKEIEALEEGKDALKNANDERQRELDLIEARNNLENAKKRKIWVYSDDGGFSQVQDEGAVKEAEEKYRDAITEIQVAEIDKEIELREKQKEALEENTKALTELEQNIQNALTVEQAKADLGLSDEKELLNLPADVQESIKNGLADAMTQKNNKENEGTKHKAVTLDDVLKSFGAKVSASELGEGFFDNIRQSAYNSAVKGFADSLNAYRESAVSNVVNNNSGETVISPTINIYDATDPQKVGKVVVDKITDLFNKVGNSAK